MVAMQRKLFMAVCAMILLCLPTTAQTAAKGKATHVLYEDQTWLSQNGSDVWLVRLDLEWPLVLDDHTMPSLQTYLSEHLLNVQAGSLSEALDQLHQKTGTPLSQMPADDQLTRHYLTSTLRISYYEQERYVSLLLDATETDSQGKTVRKEHRRFTYDLCNDRILSKEDVFHASNMAGTYDDTFRIVFENDIAQNALCDEADMPNIDLRALPQDFAIEGRLVRFSLGGQKDNLSWETLERLNQLSLLNRKFLKWYNGEEKKKKQPATLATHPIDEQDYFTGADSVYLVGAQPPQYATGTDSLLRFIARNIQVPADYIETGTTGRVLVSFVVERDGQLSNFDVIRSLARPLDRAVVAVLRRSAPWQPGLQDGQPVRMRFVMPVNLQLK